MNAKEAREKSLQVTGDLELRQYAQIQAKIKAAVDLGNTYTHLFEALKPSVVVKLRNDGFEISSMFDQRDGTTTKISW